MSSNKVKTFYPFFSVVSLVLVLFIIVFLTMEERRTSYIVLKKTREHKVLKEQLKQKEIILAKLMKPQVVEKIATQKLTLKRATQSQIIHLNPDVSMNYLNKEEGVR